MNNLRIIGLGDKKKLLTSVSKSIQIISYLPLSVSKSLQSRCKGSKDTPPKSPCERLKKSPCSPPPKPPSPPPAKPPCAKPPKDPCGKAKKDPCAKAPKRCVSKASICQSLGSSSGGQKGLVRALRSGKCRMGLIPDEWFNFFYPMTGVSGPYLFMIGVGNYLCSKEIFVMEHEYYTGLSIALILYLISTRLGPQIGAVLDKEVDAIQAGWQKVIDDEIKAYQNVITQAKMCQIRAKGQDILMEAKKLNIALQLEAVMRERRMMVYKAVVDRMEYQYKKARSIARIQQKWMIQWILNNVKKSITPEFQKSVLSSAIVELSAMKRKK